MVAVLLALASFGALFAMLYTADADFVAGALTKLLGRHVEIGKVQLHFGRRLEVELEQVRVADPSAPDAPPALEVAHARGVQAWPRLLAGQYLPLDWTLDAPLLRIRTSAEPLAFDPAALPRLGLLVQDGRVEVTSAAGERWSLERLQLDAKRAGFGTRVEGEGSARLTRGEKPVSELALRFSATRAGADLRGTFARLDLATLPKTLVTPKGRAEGGFDLSLDSAGVKGRIQARVERFELVIPKYSGPIAPRSTQVVADVDWRGNNLSLQLHPLALDDLVASGSVKLGSGSGGRLTADLRLLPFEPGRQDRVNGLNFLSQRFKSWAKVRARIEAGVAEDIHLTVDVPTATFRESLSYDTPMAENAFVLQLRVRDGTYRPKPDETPLTQMQGELEIRGNVMDIRRLRMTDDGEPLPEINVRLDGMHRLVHLPDEEDHVVGGPGTKLSGLAAMAAAFRASDSTAKEPTVIQFEDLALRMPQLILPVRQASGELRFPNGGIVADPVRGTLGGSPAEFSVKWDRAIERVDVRIRYLEGDPGPGGPITGPRWLSAKVAFQTLSLPEWPVQGLHGRLTAEGAAVTASGIKARLADGDFDASGHVDLSQAGRAPFDLDLGVSGFDPKQVCETFGLPADSVTGRGYVKLKLSGALRPGGDFRTEGRLEGHLVLRDGTVARLPTLVAIARVPSLAGVTGLLGKPLPYRTVEADLALDGGKLGIADGKLLGPELRILASGEMDFHSAERRYDFIVALLFLQTLDRVLAEVPIVRNVMLGEDKNLIAVYLRIEGPKDNLTVTPLPPAAVESVVGFASNAVLNGVKSLGRLIPGRRASPPPAEPNPPPLESNPPPQVESPLR